MDVSFRSSVALKWDRTVSGFTELPFEQLTWSVSDTGTMFGAILVERLRTYAGKLVDIDDHRTRLFSAATQLGIDTTELTDRFTSVCEQLLDRNRSLLGRCGDVSVVVLVSPGETGDGHDFGKRPTCMAHITPLPFQRLAYWYQFGTELVSGTNRTVPESCWPTQIKSRSRLPYLLSELHLKPEGESSLALLKTTHGTIADTSVANILLVMPDNELVSPSAESALIGCTLKSIDRLANGCGLKIEYRDVFDQDLAQAKEVILTGTNGGVWFARSIDGHTVGNGAMGPVCRELSQRWKEHVGMDFVEQACTIGLQNQ